MCPLSGPALRGVFQLVLAVVLSAFARAQITETPYTIAPGKVLFEVDGLRLSYDRADAAGNKHTTMAVASTVVSAGITSYLDAQIAADVFLRRSFEFRGGKDTTSGIGDAAFRMKWTFWRDETLGAAMAVIPYVRVPTSTGAVGTDHIEGGFILPWAMSLRGAADVGAMLRWDQRRNEANDGYDAHWTVTSFAQRTLTSRLRVYGEVELQAASTGLSEWTGQAGAGVLFQVTSFVQLDYELLRALNDRALDWTHVFRVNWVW